jgi:hypothetical protein
MEIDKPPNNQGHHTAEEPKHKQFSLHPTHLLDKVLLQVEKAVAPDLRAAALVLDIVVGLEDFQQAVEPAVL